jgi:1,4-alpha-glucan branching enzyme
MPTTDGSRRARAAATGGPAQEPVPGPPVRARGSGGGAGAGGATDVPRAAGAPRVPRAPDEIASGDLWLFHEGTHSRLHHVLGGHLLPGGGARFAVWAPNAERVSVIGDANGWDRGAHALRPQGDSGIWVGTQPEGAAGQRYKFHIVSRARGYRVDKADPFAALAEQPPRTASVLHDLAYEWSDGEWMATRRARNGHHAPVSVYELHVGSWRHAPGEHRSLNYRELAEPLADHVSAMGFTHVELLPVMEHPFYGSWGYQTTGYFAPTSRFGGPQDLMYLIDHLHQRGIGVILDWVPSHFPSDEHGLAYFDGTHLYEHEDPRKGFHPDWNSLIFNYDRHEVRSFLLSSACSWLERYHADGIRVDAVASMLYLDYSRKAGEWIPNEFGGNENLGALRFLKQLNETVYSEFPDVQTVAEESTAWPMVSRPTYVGGLGFGFKWDMGWMHDTLEYLGNDPVHRRYHHDRVTFRALYAFTENYVLPLSHDEVVHGKGSLLGKMPGDQWQRFANLRLLFGYQFGQSGKKLLFMGDEIAQVGEWNHDAPVSWEVLGDPLHEGVRRWVAHLNGLYRAEPGLHELDCDPAGFQWVDASDTRASVVSFLRLPRTPDAGDNGALADPPAGVGARRPVLVVANFTPVPRDYYSIGVPAGGRWVELANSDASEYGGSGWGNLGGVDAVDEPMHGRPWSLPLVLPPLGLLVLAPG